MELNIYQMILVFYQIVIFILIFYLLKDTIYSRIYGVRYKRYVEIDTGRIGYCILSKDLDVTKIRGITKSIKYENIDHGIIYTYNNLAENVKTEYANDKARFYMNSNEFHTVISNDVYQRLLITKAEQLITIIFALSCLTFLAMLALGYMHIQEDKIIQWIAANIPDKTQIVT